MVTTQSPGSGYAGMTISCICAPGLDCFSTSENLTMSCESEHSRSSNFRVCMLCPLWPVSSSNSKANLDDRVSKSRAFGGDHFLGVQETD